MKNIYIVLWASSLIIAVLCTMYYVKNNPDRRDSLLKNDRHVEINSTQEVAEVIETNTQDTPKEIDVVPDEKKQELVYGNAEITTNGQYRYIISNGLPDHETGQFPGKGNPNAISEQDHSYKVLLNPVRNSLPSTAHIPGVSLNGLPLEPGTGETYDNDILWPVEAVVAGVGELGMDWSNAHVQRNGTYHYHAVPNGLLENATKDQGRDLIQLAWASDGFPIYYSLSNKYNPSWQLKTGIRPGGPGGIYDGSYTPDFEYVPGSGDLDQCNGIVIDGQYGYLITNSFPYIQRCVFGTPDATFDRNVPSNRSTAVQQPQEQTSPASAPPQAAFDACSGKSLNNSCSVTTPKGGLSGTCRNTPDSQFVCVPN